MINKELYRKFCDIEINMPLFYKDWWLDAVCGPNNWDVILVEKGQEILAYFPFYIYKKAVFKTIIMPPFTQRLGAIIKYNPSLKYSSKIGLEKEMMLAILKEIPKFDYFEVRFDYSVTNWLPFYWNNYQQTTCYSYVINDLSDLNKVSENFKSNIRNKINKAGNIVEVKKGLSIDEFYRMYRMVFDRKNIKTQTSFEQMKTIDKALKEHNSGEIFYALDEKNQIHSALYLLWDEKTSYLQMIGEDPNLRSSGAGILLVSEVIKYTKNILNLNQFDFAGSMIEPIEEVRRGFGAVQTPYFKITKVNNLNLRLFFALKYVMNRKINFN